MEATIYKVESNHPVTRKGHTTYIQSNDIETVVRKHLEISEPALATHVYKIHINSPKSAKQKYTSVSVFLEKGTLSLTSDQYGSVVLTPINVHTC